MQVAQELEAWNGGWKRKRLALEVGTVELTPTPEQARKSGSNSGASFGSTSLIGQVTNQSALLHQLHQLSVVWPGQGREKTPELVLRSALP